MCNNEGRKGNLETIPRNLKKLPYTYLSNQTLEPTLLYNLVSYILHIAYLRSVIFLRVYCSYIFSSVFFFLIFTIFCGPIAFNVIDMS